MMDWADEWVLLISDPLDNIQMKQIAAALRKAKADGLRWAAKKIEPMDIYKIHAEESQLCT